MIARRMKSLLAAAIGVSGLVALSACTANEPYGARFDENGYSYTHRQHGLYNDSQYRYRRMRDDDAGYRYGYAAPPVRYNYYYYDDDGFRRSGYRPAYRYYDDDGDLIYNRSRHRD